MTSADLTKMTQPQKDAALNYLACEALYFTALSERRVQPDHKEMKIARRHTRLRDAQDALEVALGRDLSQSELDGSMPIGRSLEDHLDIQIARQKHVMDRLLTAATR